MKTIIKGTGRAMPSRIIKNDTFVQNEFYSKDGVKNEKEGQAIVDKLKEITGIKERRYITDEEDSVPLMAEASKNALVSSGIDAEQLDGIIVAHNAGNMVPGIGSFHPVPNLAANLKHALKIENPDMYAIDILFGCPGWLQGVIQAHQAIQMGDASHILVVGLEVASRMLDPHDLDSMIFADGCGAVIMSGFEGEKKGIISYKTFSHGQRDLRNIYLGRSNKPGVTGESYVKMNGREVYKYATTWLPKAIRSCLDKGGYSIEDIDIFLFHQANEKMLHAIANNIARMYNAPGIDFTGRIPMTIQTLGNTSVATIPTMMDMILKEELPGYMIEEGHLAVLASVGAGMHCNAMLYRF